MNKYFILLILLICIFNFSNQIVDETKMVLVEKGSFIMGSDNKNYYEKPAHKVTLTYDYYIAKHETTFDEYDEYCEDTNENKPKDLGWGRGKKSVIYVSWWDAIKYCNWKSKKMEYQ